MIIYEAGGSWLPIVFAYVGTVWGEIIRPFLLWATLALLFYVYVEAYDVELNSSGHTSLGSTMSFLLIFRANQAYARYWEGRTRLSEFFAALKDFSMMTGLHVHGGKKRVAFLLGDKSIFDSTGMDDNDWRCQMFKIDIFRYVIAYAVTLKLHTRIALEGFIFGSVDAHTKWMIDWDRLRLRQLLTEDEFKKVDACWNIDEHVKKTSLQSLIDQFRGKCNSGPPRNWPDEFDVNGVNSCQAHQVLLFYLRKEVMNSVNDFSNSVPWGIKERFVPNLIGLVKEAQRNFDIIDQIITTPIALPYAALCKTLCLIWMLANPLTLDHSLGFYGSYVTSVLIVFALLGIDAISTELENPFGDDDNDLDILENIITLESEVLGFLDLSEFPQTRDKFIWRRIPKFIAESCSKPLSRYLVVSEFAGEEVVPSGSATPASSNRSSDRLLDHSDSDASSRGDRPV